MNALQHHQIFQIVEKVRSVTRNVPESHGALHLLTVADIAEHLAVCEGVDPFRAAVAGALHDLRFWDEEERKIRKIVVSPERRSTESPESILRSISGFSEVETAAILRAIECHNTAPTPNESALHTVLRDADRCARQGYEGLLSILVANRFYGVPFYQKGAEILWDLERPLVKNEDIKSAMDDIHACNWWPIMETSSGKELFRVMCGVNFRFLELFAQSVEDGTFSRLTNPYSYWIRRLRGVLEDQEGERALQENPGSAEYRKLAVKLEDPSFL
ncbi:MAG: HD domain-containing protein [Candidatus Brennerbacteria bacterium]